MDNNLKNSLQDTKNNSSKPKLIETQLDTSEEADNSTTKNMASPTKTQTITEEISEIKQARKHAEKPLIIFGGICIAAFVAMMIISPSSSSVESTDAVKDALNSKMSTAPSAGIILLADDKNLGAQDYTITHKSTDSETKIWVWDYAAQDGDYVQVLVNGAPIGDAFMIKHKPIQLMVPSTGEVQIKGIRDGGGGITYAVRYDLNGTNYFNSAPEGKFNTYTLIKQ